MRNFPNSKPFFLAAILLLGSLHAASPTLTEQTPSPSGYAFTNHPSLSFSIDVPEDRQIVFESVELLVDGVTQTLNFNEMNTKWSATVAANLGDGAHSAIVSMTDDLGTIWPMTWTFYVDTSTPAIGIYSPTEQLASETVIFGWFTGMKNSSLGSLDVRIEQTTTYPANVIWLDETSGVFSIEVPESTPGWFWADAILTSPGGIQCQSGISVQVVDLHMMTGETYGFWNGWYTANTNNMLQFQYQTDGSFWPTGASLVNEAGTVELQSFTLTTSDNNDAWFGSGWYTVPDGVYDMSVSWANSDIYMFSLHVPVKIDTTPPQFAYDYPANSSTISSSGYASLNVFDPVDSLGFDGSGIDVSSISVLDENSNPVSFYAWESGLEVTGLSNGVYNFTVSASDKAGNTNIFIWTITVTLPPTLSIIGPANNTYDRAEATIISATISDPLGLNFENFHIYIDDVPTTEVGEPTISYSDDNKIISYTFTHQASQTLSEGPHTIRVVCANLAWAVLDTSDWNDGFDATPWTYTLDKTAPNGYLTLPYSNGSPTVFKPDTTLTAMLIDTGSGLNTQTLQVFLIDPTDQETPITNFTVSEQGILSVPVTALTEGPYGLRVIMPDLSTDWQIAGDSGNITDVTWNLMVDLHSIVVTVTPSYGVLPVTFFAQATKGGVDITDQVIFTYSAPDLSVTQHDNNQFDIGIGSVLGNSSIDVSASEASTGGDDPPNTGTTSEPIKICVSESTGEDKCTSPDDESGCDDKITLTMRCKDGEKVSDQATENDKHDKYKDSYTTDIIGIFPKPVTVKMAGIQVDGCFLNGFEMVGHVLDQKTYTFKQTISTKLYFVTANTLFDCLASGMQGWTGINLVFNNKDDDPSDFTDGTPSGTSNNVYTCDAPGFSPTAQGRALPDLAKKVGTLISYRMIGNTELQLDGATVAQQAWHSIVTLKCIKAGRGYVGSADFIESKWERIGSNVIGPDPSVTQKWLDYTTTNAATDMNPTNPPSISGPIEF